MDFSNISSNMPAYITGQALTLLAFVLFWMSLTMKSKKSILVTASLSQVVLAFAYLFLSNINGVLNSIFNIFRNITGIKMKDKSSKAKNIVFAILLVIVTTMYALTFDGVATIFIMLAAIVELIATQFCDEQRYRILMMIVCILFDAFFIVTANIAGLVCETIMLIIAIVSYIKYRKKDNTQ